MVKYVDSGMEDTGGKGKKKVKKGFKEDRRANYEKMLAKKNGKFRGKEPAKPTHAARVKSITFDPSALKDYVLTLHKRKNERRVQAFVDVKRKMRRDHARDRRQQREEARLAYNNYARVPILPNYTYRLPQYAESDSDSDNFDEDDHVEEYEDDHVDDVEEGPVSGVRIRKATKAKTSDEDDDDDEAANGDDLPWMFLGDGDESTQRAEDDVRARREGKLGKGKAGMKRRRTAHNDGDDEDNDDDESEESAALRAAAQGLRRGKERKRRLKLVTEPSTLHSMPVSMTNMAGSAHTEDPAPAADHAAVSGIDDEFVTVEVKPLFGRGGTRLGMTSSAGAPVESGKSAVHKRVHVAAKPSLPSQDFSDLPAVVEEELLRLRKETKGPTRTKPRLQMQKELQKIRKIRKYSRKGHGKKSTSGKRKNRKK